MILATMALRSASDGPEPSTYLAMIPGFVRRLRGTLSQREFAERASALLGEPIDSSRISEWERGYHEPSASRMFALMAASKESVDEIVFGGQLSKQVAELTEVVRLMGQRLKQLEPH